MKTIAFLIFFEVFVLLGVWIYHESTKLEPPTWKTDITHIECVNDSLSQKLTEDSLRFEKALQQSKNILKQSKKIQNEK